MRLARFQREALEELLAPGVRSGGMQLPRGNAKSTLWAAVGLWAVCDAPDAPLVPLIAHSGPQAVRTLLWPIRRMVTLAKAAGDLDEDVVIVYSSHTDRRVWSPWNDGQLLVLPAEESALQGLNPTVALVDEAQTMPPGVLSAVAQGAGKRDASLVLAIGTPSPGGQDSALFGLRQAVADGARVAWVEHAADAGCPLDDRAQWRQANPAIGAGFLHADVLEVELKTVSEPEFRGYRLGQWVDTVGSSWLPYGAWDACPHVPPPVDGAEVLIGVAGMWSSVALVGATPDGAVFLAWTSDSATDDDIEAKLGAAADRWQVTGVVIAPRIRPNLVARLQAVFDVEVWPNTVEAEVTSSTEWRRGIIEGRVAHDHHAVLGEHVAASVARSTTDGSLRLTGPADGTPVDAARAARMAWWRATQSAMLEAPRIF
jgi:hypothetical protein